MTIVAQALRRPLGRAISTFGLVAAFAMSTPAGAAAKAELFKKNGNFVQGAGVAQRGMGGPHDGRALERFRLDFTERFDARIRDIGVEALQRGQVRGWLNANGSSPLTLRAKWWDVTRSPTIERRRLSAKCDRKKCRVQGLDRGLDKVPLLVGFVFHNLMGPKKIERLAVYPEVRTGPNAQVTYYAHLEGDGRARYTVDIDVVLVDKSMIAGQYSASASADRGPVAKVPLDWKYGILALQGFDVQFTNGSHELQEFAIEPVPGTNAVKGVYFSDSNDDDPIRAKLWWADLQSPGLKPIKIDKPLPQQQPKFPGPTPQLDPNAGKKPTPKRKPAPKKKSFPGPTPTKKF